MDHRIKPGDDDLSCRDGSLSSGAPLLILKRRLARRAACGRAWPAPFAKIFHFTRRANHLYKFAHPTPSEGRIAIVTDAGRDSVDAAASGAKRDAGRVRQGSVRDQTAR